MAYTINRKKKTVVGDLRMVILSCSADAVTQNIDTGLDYVYGFTITPVSMTSYEVFTALPNVGATGTALVGFIGVSAFTATDEFMLMAWGT